MGNQMNGMDSGCLAHFAETFFFKVVQNGIHSIAPHPGLGDTKARVLAVVNTTMSAAIRPFFAKDHKHEMEFNQRSEARVEQRDQGAYYLPTGNDDDHAADRRRGEKRDHSVPPPSPSRRLDQKLSSPDNRPKQATGAGGGAAARPQTKNPCRANLAQALQLTGALPCPNGSSCSYQHCTSGRVFVSTFTQDRLRKFINDFPDRVPQPGGGVDLLKSAYLTAFNAIK
jgi:hypothetical protein